MAEEFKFGDAGAALGTLQLLAQKFTAVFNGVIGLDVTSHSMNDSERKLGTLASQATVALPQATGFRLVRYFSLASVAAFLLFVAAIQYFDRRQDDLITQAQQNQNALFTQMNASLVQRHNTAATAYLLKVYEAGSVNLARVLANAMWEKDFAPLLAKAQRIPIDQCRAIAEAKDADGKIVQPGQKQACYAGIGRTIMALPEFQTLDAKVLDTMQKSAVYKIKVYDLRGITAYSSERKQIGEEKAGNAGWQNAVAGNATSALTHRGKFSTFEGVVQNRDLIETYVPVLAPGSARIAAVFEIYSDVTQFLKEIKSTSSEIRNSIATSNAQFKQAMAANQDAVRKDVNLQHLIILGLLALLYLVLFLVVRNAQRIIDARDIEHTRAASMLARQKDLYAMLSQTNEAIVRIAGRQELFEAVCRIAVEQGHFRFAFIALISEADRSVRVAAQYGEDAGYVSQIRITVDTRQTEEAKCGPVERALRNGAPVISNDFLNERDFLPFRDRAQRADVRAVAAFPLRLEDTVIGSLNLYAGEVGFFSGDLLPTLREIASDVSFALDNFQRQVEHNLAIDALRESEKLLSESQSVAGFGSYVLDIPTGRWSSSAVLDGIFGIDDNYERSVTGWQSLIHPEWRDQLSRYLAVEVLGTHGRFDREYPIIRKTDGETRWVHGQGELEFDSQGQPRKMFGTISDITERKQSEQALRAAEEQFRGLVEQSIAGTYIVQDGKFEYVNPRFAEIFGYGSADELIGRDVLSIVAEKDRGAVVENIRQRIEGGIGNITYDFAGLRKDGSIIDVGVHGARATHRGLPAVIGMVQDISEKKRAEEQIQRYVAQLETAFMSTVKVATTLGEMRDPYTAGHQRRVAEVAVAIGAELGFDARRQEGLRVAGYLHDIGKITIPAEILSKPGKLSAIEFQLIQGHPQSSYDVLKDLEFPWPVAQIALQHHERMDGSGYPQGLKGETILLEARIMAVADVMEAMSSHRPYRPGLGIEATLTEIERGRGSAYDPVVADACLKLFREKGYVLPA